MSERCSRAAQWISRAADGECPEEDLQNLNRHIQECPSCRDMAEIVERVDDLLARGKDIPDVPPFSVPQGVLGRPSSRWKTWFLPAAAVFCALVLGFGGGVWWRTDQTTKEFPESIRVASAARWNTDGDPLRREAALAAMPISDAVSRYQEEISRILAEDEVDWSYLRHLVEEIGELRTDMELITLHIAYVERKYKSKEASVSAWSDSLGFKGSNAIF